MRLDDEDVQQMVVWRAAPHVHQWWDPDLPDPDSAAIIKEYEADTLPGSISTACFIELRGQPIGFIQFYRWSDYAEEATEAGMPVDEDSWGIDVFIGNPDLVGRGYGTTAVDLMCEHLFAEKGAASVALTTELDNDVAIRAYEKAGFTKRGRVLDTDTRGGERVWCWLMIRDRESKAVG